MISERIVFYLSTDNDTKARRDLLLSCFDGSVWDVYVTGLSNLGLKFGDDKCVTVIVAERVRAGKLSSKLTYLSKEMTNLVLVSKETFPDGDYVCGLWQTGFSNPTFFSNNNNNKHFQMIVKVFHEKLTAAAGFERFQLGEVLSDTEAVTKLLKQVCAAITIQTFLRSVKWTSVLESTVDLYFHPEIYLNSSKGKRSVQNYKASFSSASLKSTEGLSLVVCMSPKLRLGIKRFLKLLAKVLLPGPSS